MVLVLFFVLGLIVCIGGIVDSVQQKRFLKSPLYKKINSLSTYELIRLLEKRKIKAHPLEMVVLELSLTTYSMGRMVGDYDDKDLRKLLVRHLLNSEGPDLKKELGIK